MTVGKEALLRLNHEFRCGAYFFHASLLSGNRVYGFTQERGTFVSAHYVDLRDREVVRCMWYRAWEYTEDERVGVGGVPCIQYHRSKHTKAGIAERKARQQGQASVLVQGKKRDELLSWRPSPCQDWLLPFLDGLPVDKIRQEIKAKNIPEPLGLASLVQIHSGGYHGLEEDFEQWVLQGKEKG